jgi:hypothetical protein
MNGLAMQALVVNGGWESLVLGEISQIISEDF